jgi:two-component system CheB/CheR fusion protein
MQIDPDVLYVTAPDAGWEIVGRALKMTSRAPMFSELQMPIDRFLRSLAQEYGRRAVGVILSGAGADGAAGLEAVKAAGGMTFAQDPRTAKFSSMPKTAIESGCVDFVLSPEGIAAELTKLGRYPYPAEGEDTGSLGSAEDVRDELGPILTLLRDTTGIDFALYRETTIRRRIMRRVALRSVGSLEEYREQIENDPRELSALQRDLLISVTRFFRDPESFESLKRIVFPRLVQGRPPDAGIRIWAPGSATGEEAYSVAVSLHEYFEETGQVYPVKIFSTDISSTAIETARSGKYPETIAADVSPKRLNRYFSKIDGGYQISKAMREWCVFSTHDLTQDPPFSKLDLISCRNVLIFFGSVRNNVIALFHYALKPGGFLVLGTSETDASNLFSIVEGTRNIYTKIEIARKWHPLFTEAVGPPRSAADRRAVGVPAGELTSVVDLQKELGRILLSGYRGAGVVVDESLEVLEILGQTAPFLTLPPGKVTLNLFKLIPETRIFLEVEKLVREVERSGEAARKDRVPYRADGTTGEVNVEVIPLGRARKRALLVLFEPAIRASDIEPDTGSRRTDGEIVILKQDLIDARQRLMSLLEERTSTEEDQNTAEEAISANEELQSLNEELEMAKEDLRSTNEELSTLNEELQSNNAALIEARDFAMSIIETVAAPLLVLDIDLRIKAANPAFYRGFRMSPQETEGQFLYSVANGRWDIPRLREMLKGILPDNRTVQDFEIERDFPGIGRRVLVLSARQIDGLQQILLGIDDITERKERVEATLRESEERFTNMADAAPVMIWASGPDKGCTFFNKGWLDFTGRTMEEELGAGWTKSVHPEDLDRCMDIYSSSFDARRSFRVEYRVRRADGEYRWLHDHGVPRFDPRGVFVGYIGSCIDINDLKRTQEENFAKQKLESLGRLAGGIAHDFNNLLGGVLAHSELGLEGLAGGSSPAEELERIRSVAIRGGEIVRQLMIYAGQESEVFEMLDVSAIVQDMLELLKVAVSKHATLETALGEGLPAVRANPAQLQQIVMNLITNASEAMGDRDGVIRVTTGRMKISRNSPLAAAEHLAEGDYLRLEVSDTGRGMTVETQARVFDPFFTTKLAGHGLGLAVVHGIVRSLGGTIRIMSALGEGTTFQILLPSAETAAQASRGAISPEEKEPLGPRKPTILIVEDEDLIRLAATKMLRRMGLSVLEAGDGSTALDLIRAHKDKISVVLLDITLPGASSREVFEEAKRLRPEMTVIVTSAYSKEMAATSLAARVERFIRKPYKLSDLIDMIRQALPS